MSTNLAKMLGMKLDDVIELPFVVSLNARVTIEEIEDRVGIIIPSAGIAFNANACDQTIMSIFLHSEGYDDYRGYTGALPEGISFSYSRERVRSHLGKPSSFGGGNIQRLVGKWPAWDLYERDSYALHIEYAGGEQSIDLVTLMRLDVVPR